MARVHRAEMKRRSSHELSGLGNEVRFGDELRCRSPATYLAALSELASLKEVILGLPRRGGHFSQSLLPG